MGNNLMLPHEDTWGILPLQNCILQIAQYIDSLCLDNNIDYFLMGGSALGAVRHNGFIPWDDDLDIFMTPANYKKFRDIFNKYGDKSNYYLQEHGKCGDMVVSAKLRYNKSSFIEPVFADMDMHHGVFVDIFILHTCPDNQMCRLWQYFWARYVVVKGLSNRAIVRGGTVRKLILSVFKLLPKRFLLNFSLKQIYRFSHKPSSYYCHFLGRANLQKGLYLRDYFVKPTRHAFESIELNVPNNVEEYLESRFGDYMKLPSKKEIMHFQHTTEWSVDSSFKRVGKGTFKDEKYVF